MDGKINFVPRMGREKLECYHSVLAVKKAKKILKNVLGKEMHDPFIEPSNRTVELFNATRDSIFYEDKEKYIHPLNEMISEILLWKMAGYRNHEREHKKN